MTKIDPNLVLTGAIIVGGIYIFRQIGKGVKETGKKVADIGNLFNPVSPDNFVNRGVNTVSNDMTDRTLGENIFRWLYPDKAAKLGDAGVKRFKEVNPRITTAPGSIGGVRTTLFLDRNQNMIDDRDE